MASDTIFAIATAQGRAAVAIVRISGSKARFVLETLAGAVPSPRIATLTTLRDPASGDVLDKALVLFFQAPASFTGEDVVELHLHGGRAVVAGVLDALHEMGLRGALPGEFTRRALANGKLDLTEVEGLADLIDAQTAAQRRQALRLLSGSLGSVIAAWRNVLLDMSARIEAEIDFSDEDDVDDAPLEIIRGHVRALRSEIATVLDGARRSERLREGVVVVIAGPPNAGKSSLLNALAQEDVAIVSDIPARPATRLRYSWCLGAFR